MFFQLKFRGTLLALISTKNEKYKRLPLGKVN